MPRTIQKQELTAEARRLEQDRRREKHWKRWGPYLSERAWGTVREDYSPYGTAWDYLPHDHARSKAYRWNEDGLAGICDRRQFICFAVALWNGHDPILKERAFGLTGSEGNHGEDVKEYYFYLDSTPTHSYMKYLYKYPQAEFPYARLVEENRLRDKHAPEYELIDTGIFDDNRYFDVFVEYAKAAPEDILIRIQVINRGPDEAQASLLPTIWFRNTWSWDQAQSRPQLRAEKPAKNAGMIELDNSLYGRRHLLCEGRPELLFTENDTNSERLYGIANASPYVKDGINDYIVHGKKEAVNPDRVGTKAAAHYPLTVGPGDTVTVRLRFTDQTAASGAENLLGKDFDRIFADRRREADEFYASVISVSLAGRTQRHASILRGASLVQAVLPLRRQGLAGGRSGATAAAGRTQGRPQSRMVASVQRRRHLDAGQVGVPLVRRLGPRVPLRAAGAGGPRLRQGPTGPDAARVVHAPQRAIASLRMGLRGREPAGACVGRLARVQDRREAPWQG